ncbi:DNA-binding HxlR family transcriptional regulator [Duganella sp. 1411]|jgi:DNA-binding HxlR family transcriptional regulator|uniref:winged helix-turn-helix transcriptional regulator n=1 Tax=Duganella sp. 1411 TaxID=2806572 RepID=UPI001AE94D29|nr:helix-turn-helix domain-containing protein [Duganella sp. 1411]MBP1204849.1 DNA-binding HxlR family transcriptional regulator [Duganella sp. 1411]
MTAPQPRKSLRSTLATLDDGQRAKLLAPDCPSRAVLAHITSRWGVLVLVVLLDGTHRFSQLRRAVGGVSEKMLAQTLDALAYDGLVLRVAQQVLPPHVEYSLTPLGREAAERLEALVDWIEDNFPQIKQAQEAASVAAA